MGAFLVELRAILDRDRVVATGCVAAGAVVLAALLAGNPGITIGDGGWIVVAGITFSAAYQVYSSRRDAGRPDAGPWGLAAGAGLILAIAAFWAATFLLRPIVEASPTLAGNPVPLAVVVWVLLSLGAVLWARGRQQRGTALALAISMGTILGGVAALRAGGTWTPVAMIALLLGFGVFMVAVAPGYRARFGGSAVQTPQPEAAPPPQARAPVRKADPRSVKRGRRRGPR